MGLCYVKNGIKVDDLSASKRLRLIVFKNDIVVREYDINDISYEYEIFQKFLIIAKFGKRGKIRIVSVFDLDELKEIIVDEAVNAYFINTAFASANYSLKELYAFVDNLDIIPKLKREEMYIYFSNGLCRDKKLIDEYILESLPECLSFIKVARKSLGDNMERILMFMDYNYPHVSLFSCPDIVPDLNYDKIYYMREK